MSTSIVEKALAGMEQLIDEAKSVPFSTKTLMDTEELSKLIEDIRLNMPEEITQARRIAQERRDILDQAKIEAENIIDKARQRADLMIEEHQITKEAKSAAEDIFRQTKAETDELIECSRKHAEEMTLEAEKWAVDIKKNASIYVEKVIKEADVTLSNSVNNIRNLRQSLKDALDREKITRPRFDD